MSVLFLSGSDSSSLIISVVGNGVLGGGLVPLFFLWISGCVDVSLHKCFQVMPFALLCIQDMLT